MAVLREVLAKTASIRRYIADTATGSASWKIRFTAWSSTAGVVEPAVPLDRHQACTGRPAKPDHHLRLPHQLPAAAGAGPIVTACSSAAELRVHSRHWPGASVLRQKGSSSSAAALFGGHWFRPMAKSAGSAARDDAAAIPSYVFSLPAVATDLEVLGASCRIAGSTSLAQACIAIQQALPGRPGPS